MNTKVEFWLLSGVSIRAHIVLQSVYSMVHHTEFAGLSHTPVLVLVIWRRIGQVVITIELFDVALLLASLIQK